MGVCRRWQDISHQHNLPADGVGSGWDLHRWPGGFQIRTGSAQECHGHYSPGDSSTWSLSHPFSAGLLPYLHVFLPLKIALMASAAGIILAQYNSTTCACGKDRYVTGDLRHRPSDEISLAELQTPDAMD